MYSLEDVNDCRQFLDDEKHQSIYESSVRIHDNLIVGSFQNVINRIIQERLDVMRNCGIKPNGHFYSSFKNEIRHLLTKSVNEFFDENGD